MRHLARERPQSEVQVTNFFACECGEDLGDKNISAFFSREKQVHHILHSPKFKIPSSRTSGTDFAEDTLPFSQIGNKPQKFAEPRALLSLLPFTFLSGWGGIPLVTPPACSESFFSP